MANEILQPINPIEAFRETGEDNLASQITLYLLLGALFGFGREAVQREAERTREQFPIPEPKERFRLDPATYVDRFSERYSLPDPRLPHWFWINDDEVKARRYEIANELVQSLYKRPSPDVIADLILLGVSDPNELIAASSAISFLDIFREVSLATNRLIQIIAEQSSTLASEIAQTALMRMGYPQILGPTGAGGSGSSSQKTSTTLLIHGSQFGFVGQKIGDWWKPGGDFHSYLKANHCSNLYEKPDYFSWSGGWSDHARQLAAIDLRDWVNKRNIHKPDILAHSHGGNVVMWATQLGLEVGTLVLLSCPEHMHHYSPEFSRIDQVVSYQIQLDWIILADGGGIFFNHPNIDDRVQNRWFRRHVDTHEPDFWKSFGLTIQ